jgi:hypothetical protein
MSASELDKGKPIVGFLTPTNPKAATFSEPTESALNHPSSSGKASLAGDGTIFNEGFISFAPMLDVSDITFLLYKVMNIGKVIASVSAQMLLGVGTRHDNRDNQIIRRPLVMDVGTRYKDCQRRATSVHQNMNLTAPFATVYRAFARSFPSQWSGACFGIQRLPLPFDMPLAMVELHHLPHDSGKHLALLPLLKAVMQGCAANTEPISMDCLPLATCPQNIPNPIQNGSVIRSLSPCFSRLIHLWDQFPDPSPHRSWHAKVIDILRFCVTILIQGVSVLMLSWLTLSERDTPSFSTMFPIYG